MTPGAPALPVADRDNGLDILKGLLRDRSLLTALTLMNRHVGDAFQITMPRFQPAVFIGPESNRQILVTDRHKLSWRNRSDPVARLLRQGILVIDGVEHDYVRGLMDPAYQRRTVLPYVDEIWQWTNTGIAAWADGDERDLLVEMRRIALFILTGVTFRVDISPDIDRLIPVILRLLEYISPGWWIMWSSMPRPQYQDAIDAMNAYLFRLVRERRHALAMGTMQAEPIDVLSQLIQTPGIDDGLVRDQLLTMLIAGHDTSTALLAWVFYLLGMHPEVMAQVQAEVDALLPDPSVPPTPEIVNQFVVLDQVIKEALRLYPPIHVGNRRATTDMEICGYHVPQGTRVMYSIYLSHRDQKHWEDPDAFCPARFDHAQEAKRPPFTYVPFGGGPRNCIGAAFAQVEAKVVLGRIFQLYRVELLNGAEIHPHMGATLEPRPGVRVRLHRRRR